MHCSACGEESVLEKTKYCSSCREKLKQNIDDLLKVYFHRGYQYQEIVNLLSKFHRISVSVRSLKRRLQDLDLKRRGKNIDIDIVKETVRHEIQGAGQLAVYRYI